MTDKQNHPKPSPKHQLLLAQLAELKLTQIAEIYAEVLDDAARKNSSAFDVLSALFGAEIAARHQRALARRIREARLPPRKTVTLIKLLDGGHAIGGEEVLQRVGAFLEKHLRGQDVVVSEEPIASEDSRAKR